MSGPENAGEKSGERLRIFNPSLREYDELKIRPTLKGPLDRDLKLVGNALDTRSRGEPAKQLLLIDVDRQARFFRDHQSGLLVNLDVNVRPRRLGSITPIDPRFRAIQTRIVLAKIANSET